MEAKTETQPKKKKTFRLIPLILALCGGCIVLSFIVTGVDTGMRAVGLLPTHTPKAVAVATDTPVPTPTKPPPTVTPEPTNPPTVTPFPPTATPKEEPTEVPTATVEPLPTSTATTESTEAPSVAGIGFSRADIQGRYENRWGFVFEEVELSSGQKRTMGSAPNDQGLLELIGPDSELISANISIFVSDNDSSDTLAEVASYMPQLLVITAPDWSGGGNWLQEAITDGLQAGKVTTVHDGLQFEITVIEELGMVSLGVTPAGDQ